MQITDVRVKKINSQNRMKAIASITIDDVFVIHDIKVIESENGLFIAMPSKKNPNGEYKDIAHPINTETRGMIQDLIIAKYNEAE
jgi:stage V sporulation protein G